ncbi:MAG: DNA mismatch repair endonuclease MutL [Verrucomicrobiota bacterium]
MGQQIKLLSETVTNRIAAGEVIERPASVVKELVENALDSDASRIEIEIEKGGKSLVRVTDDGCGMHADDALLCLERHATSKIATVEDLNTIDTYGFRGEALPSIASISRFRLTTRTESELSGTEIKVDGGKILAVTECGCAPGTMVEVKSLFFHTPGRRKFLKTDQTEWGHIEQYIRLCALTRFEVTLVLKHNGREVCHYASVETLEQRLRQLFDENWLRNMLPIQAEGDECVLHGMISKPGVSRSSRHEHFIFVNGRSVQSNSINFAVLEGYQNALVKGRFPVVVLFLRVPGNKVDVNVHPAKKEIRFREESSMKRFIAEAVHNTLCHATEAPMDIDLGKGYEGEPASEAFVIMPPPMPYADEEIVATPGQSKQASPADLVHHMESQIEPSVSLAHPAQEQDVIASETNHDLRVLGVIMNHYIVAEAEAGVVLIDQQAAHERILFEHFVDSFSQEEVLSQKLLIPITIELDPVLYNVLVRQMPSLQKIGICVENMGAPHVMVESLPPEMKTGDAETLIRDIAADLERSGGRMAKNQELDEEKIAHIVSRRAVKDHVVLNEKEIETLLTDLHNCQLPYTCPQGKPTMIHISRNELARKFGNP